MTNIKIQIDLNIYCSMLVDGAIEDISNELNRFDNKDCCFYYDETNNIRKLKMYENDFNAPINREFVLGGVMHFGETCIADVEDLKIKLKIQKSAKEMKFNHMSKGRDFLECLSEEKIAVFLQWLIESDLYVHFSNVNNLYFAIVDIIDTIDDIVYLPVLKEAKNQLYMIARKNYKEFYTLLSRCNYPNVVGEKIEEFYNGIMYFIENSSDELNIDLDVLRQLIKLARKQTELVYLQGNPDKTILENYSDFYIRPIAVFPYATHIFDKENQIEEIFNKYKFSHNNKEISKICFVDSVNSPLVQVSDCVVGLIGKYYTYVNSVEFDEVYRMLESVSPQQRRILHLFAKVILKSESMSKLLFSSISSTQDYQISAIIINSAR